MNCEKCIHNEACDLNRRMSGNNNPLMYDKECKLFKDKERYIELPVKVGDYVYYIKGGYYKKPSLCEVSRPCKVVEVSFKLQRSGSSVMSGFITDNGTRYSFNGIGKTVFLTREEAEKALAERSSNETNNN